MKEWIVPDEDIGVDGAYFGYVELLRCKDCANHNKCKFEQYLGTNGYCSNGERKE